jgi:hypothetical protein
VYLLMKHKTTITLASMIWLLGLIQGAMLTGFLAGALFFAAPSTILAGQEQGDVNNDAAIDLIDAILALQISAGMSPAPPSIYLSADVNGDSKIGLAEAIYALQRIAGAPVITTQPLSQTVTAGQTVTFGVVATAMPVPTYQWNKNDSAISDAISASYTTPGTTTSDNGATFSVVVRNIMGMAISSAATLTVTATTQGNTYYVDAAAANDTGNGQTVATAKKYIESGIALMSGGDTLIIRNGVYSTAADQIVSLPNGSAGAYTTIKAENDGEAVITATDGFSFNAHYIRIEGLKFSGAWQKSTEGNHIKIMRCAFQGGPATGNTVNFAVGTSYVLLEDCWFYGPGGRYKILIYRGDHIVVRRCVIRDDAGWSDTKGDPEAGIVVYESFNVSLQNVIVIDQNLSTYADSYVGAFYLTGHSGNPSSNNVEYLGCMSLNNKGENFHVDTDDGGVGLIFRDIVAYGTFSNKGGGVDTSNTSMNMTVQRATLGNLLLSVGNWGSRSITVSDSNLWAGSGSYKGSVSTTYTNSYSPDDFTGPGITHINPLTNGLLYLPRIENGSTLKTSGQGGGQKGAQIVNKIGVSGTLHGEAGYNAETGQSVWPWPNESRIKADFAAVNSGARGFAVGNSLDGYPQTLTKYIWEYLGNPIPADIGYQPH